MQTIQLPNGVWNFDETQILGKAGGFGEVFAGESPNHGQIAIKKLHLAAREAAHREMDVATALIGKNHAHIIRFFDAGEDSATGNYFVVMEMAETSLQDLIKNQASPPLDLITTILLHTAKGLREAFHFVHRDIKPGNILQLRGMWKIADFGIARFVEEVTSSKTLKNCLSPEFAAPEQWRLEHATGATDIYALGCVGYTLLTGSPPFTSNFEQRHQFEKLPRLECKDPRLSGLISIMLRKQAATRPTLSRVIELLEEIQKTPAPLPLSADNLLASANAVVAEREEARQAAEERRKQIANERQELAKHGRAVLMESMEKLWEKISHSASLATRGECNPFLFTGVLGQGRIQLDVREVRPDHKRTQPMPHSKWEIVCLGWLTVSHPKSATSWTYYLLFAKPNPSTQPRWFSIMLWNCLAGAAGLMSRVDLGDIDFALSRIMHTVALADGPTIVDDEREDEFHTRCIYLLARAATGPLPKPLSLPIASWPPF